MIGVTFLSVYYCTWSIKNDTIVWRFLGQVYQGWKAEELISWYGDFFGLANAILGNAVFIAHRLRNATVTLQIESAFACDALWVSFYDSVIMLMHMPSPQRMVITPGVVISDPIWTWQTTHVTLLMTTEWSSKNYSCWLGPWHNSHPVWHGRHKSLDTAEKPSEHESRHWSSWSKVPSRQRKHSLSS